MWKRWITILCDVGTFGYNHTVYIVGDICTDLPLDLKNALPAVEDIRSRIDMKK